MSPVTFVCQHFKERIHLGDDALAEVNHVVGYPAGFELTHLGPVVIELRVTITPGYAGACSDKTDRLRVVFDHLKIDPLGSFSVGLMLTDVDSKCSRHASSRSD